MSNKKSDILYLFDRPAEPVHMPKGENNVHFETPFEYMVNARIDDTPLILDRLGQLSEADYEEFLFWPRNHVGETKSIPVKRIHRPDLSVFLQLERREPFSLFIPKHRKLAAQLIDIFLGMQTYDDFLSVSLYCRDRVNLQMFVYALSVAILHHPDTKDLPIPPLSEIFPDKFIDSGVFARAREEANVVPAGSRLPIEIPRDYTASDLDKEHRVAYWREDIGLNLHHWHWHLVYPLETDIKIVNKDRRGELFYYMHHQIQARYNCERLCNRLDRVKLFHNWREPIPEGYFPKLNSQVASRTWPARFAGAVLKDIKRPVDQLNFDLQDLEKWRDRIYEAIHTGAYINSRGERVPLTEFGGVDVLGNIVEASILSPNQNVYGDLHNLGHVAISYCHDPDHRYLETFGIMGEPATAMRDPIFYRFHAFIDDLFLEHKNTLPEYTLQQLDFPGVEITEITVQTPNQPPNVLATFWNKSDIDLSRGLSFMPRGPVLARFTHLNHSDYTYRIVANNRNNAARRGTVRIFMAPRQDERGLPYAYRDQKELMIEMDKFAVLLKPGENTIERKSTDSSVTIPFERTFRNFEKNRPIGGDRLDQFNFCGCGWPQHMLVPKGKEEGFPMDLFIMISDYTDDAVEQDESPGSKNAASYCGLRDRRYPDTRPMGYPFDRRARPGVETLAQFLTGNMAVAQITIRYTDTLTSLPLQIGKLKSLRHLKLDENLLRCLPDNIGKLKNLLFLDLQNNCLTHLPGNIRLLPLENLNVESNSFVPLAIDNEVHVFNGPRGLKPLSLIECSSRFIVNKRREYNASLIPRKLVTYLDDIKCCCICQQVCFDDYDVQLFVNYNLYSALRWCSNQRHGLHWSQFQKCYTAKFECYTCSRRCTNVLADIWKPYTNWIPYNLNPHNMM